MTIYPLENQFIYPGPKGSKLILAAPSSPASWFRFFAPLGVGVNEEPTMQSEELDEVKIK
jgi:hypothetical protein